MKRTIIISIFSVIVLFILFVVLCTFVRKPYEVVLINRFGKIIVCSDATAKSGEHAPMMYNWYFCYPTDHPVHVDTRLHLVQTTLQQVVTKGAEPISIKTFVAWRIVDPSKFYTTLAGSDEKAKDIIDRKISGLVQAKVATHGLEELFNIDPKKVHMADMEKVIATEATLGSKDPAFPTPMAGVDDQGIQIVQVGFSRMAFPPSNADAVYERMSAERNKQAQAFVAEGQALASQIKSEGDAEAAKIKGEAVAQAEAIRGDADKRANEILASVQLSKSARDFYQYWKSLDFVKNSFTKNTYIVLSTDTPWISPLFRIPENIQTYPNKSAFPAPSTTQPAFTPGAEPAAKDFNPGTPIVPAPK